MFGIVLKIWLRMVDGVGGGESRFGLGKRDEQRQRYAVSLSLLQYVSEKQLFQWPQFELVAT